MARKAFFNIGAVLILLVGVFAFSFIADRNSKRLNFVQANSSMAVFNRITEQLLDSDYTEISNSEPITHVATSEDGKVTLWCSENGQWSIRTTEVRQFGAAEKASIIWGHIGAIGLREVSFTQGAEIESEALEAFCKRATSQ